MNHDIFISYSSKQKSIADGVCHYLEENGFKCWMAPRDIPAGSEYTDLIVKAIESSGVVVLVYSQSAGVSRWVKSEINIAFSSDKPIVPFRVDETNVANAFKILNQIHWIDAYPHYSDKLPVLLKSISGLLGRPARKVDVQGDTHKRDETIGEKPNHSEETTNSYNGHEYVDLGLPSGTLWATCNVGANKPEDFGDYFSWGDVGKTAAANCGNGWCIPSKEQWEELMQNTKSIWTTRNDVNGRLFIANNGNSLFLPAAGIRILGLYKLGGVRGTYLSSSLITEKLAWVFSFDSDNYYITNLSGNSVRAVREN